MSSFAHEAVVEHMRHAEFHELIGSVLTILSGKIRIFMSQKKSKTGRRLIARN